MPTMLARYAIEVENAIGGTRLDGQCGIRAWECAVVRKPEGVEAADKLRQDKNTLLV